jgi:CDP-6-deoxy-D-xylo-4-hexulose-3-dehydrase
VIKLVKSAFYKEKEAREALSRFVKRAPQFSFGPECKAFEEEFARYQGRKYAVLVNSGSSANLALIQALLNTGRLQKGDAVGFSALTWSTNVMPLIALGLKPVPVDIELDTLNVSSEKLKAVITKYHLKAFFATHVLGFSDDIDRIATLCRQKKVILIEDACEALGSVHAKKKHGNFGLAATFSFYVGHHFSTIEGGMIVTDDREFATALRMVRAHGWDRNVEPKGQLKLRKAHQVDPFYGLYTFYDIGYNLRPTEIQGFLGRYLLRHLPKAVKQREANFKMLAKSIYARGDLYHPLSVEHMDTVSNFAFPVICRTKLIQNKLITVCAGKVEVRPVIGGNMTRQPFFKKYVKDAPPSPNADIVHDLGLYFGNNPELTSQELKTLKDIFSNLTV